MTGPGPKQEGAALDELFYTENLDEYSDLDLGHHFSTNFEKAESELAALRSRLSEQVDLIDRLTRERDALETTIKRMTGAGEKVLEELHAPKLTVKLEPNKTSS